MTKTMDPIFLLDRYANARTDHEHLDEIKQSNKVIRLFTTEYVLKNIEELRTNPVLFRQMVRAYLNIFNYMHKNEKPTLRKVLDNLHLGNSLKQDIMELSIPGRYHVAPRSLQPERVYDEFARSAFLDVIVAFEAKDLDDYQLYEKLEAPDVIIALEAKDLYDNSCHENPKIEPEEVSYNTNFGPAFLSGLAASLYPEKFIIYNSRSASYLIAHGMYRVLAKNVHIKNYSGFNNVHQWIAERIEKPLVELDAMWFDYDWEWTELPDILKHELGSLL